MSAGELPRLATDPAVSAWVSANAGAGKTHVLTDRVTRLLLDGAYPARILCLTYTKAAAAEMSSRLFARLGEKYPALLPHLQTGSAVAIDGQIYQDALFQEIGPDSDVHILPQIAGG